MLGRDHKLIEIAALRIDGHKADQFAIALRDHNIGDRHKLLLPALAPPAKALVEVDLREMVLPGPPPQLDCRVFIGIGVGAEVEPGWPFQRRPAYFARTWRYTVTMPARSQTTAP